MASKKLKKLYGYLFFYLSWNRVPEHSGQCKPSLLPARAALSQRGTLEDMADRNVTVKFYKENLIFSGESSPFQRLHLQIIGAVAEFERALIRERQREGIALAKQRGKYKGSKKRLTEDEIALLATRALKNKENILGLAREFGISRQTAYRYLQYARCRGLSCTAKVLPDMDELL